MAGSVVSIHIARKAGAATESLTEVRAVAGAGLEGDRYFEQTGTYSDKKGPDREITLIEIEAIEALGRDYGVALAPGDARRNVVTRGIALNHLVGCEFTVGGVRLRGLRLSEPCDHLAKLTERKVLSGLIHRGGLRAQIIAGGTIHVGDAIEATPA